MTLGQRATGLAGLASRLLGWRPDEFWGATPAELATALGSDELKPVAGDDLAKLMARFPDKAE